MKTTPLFSGQASARARLAMLAAAFLAATAGLVAPASAALTGLTVGSQNGTLAAGTPGSVTFTVTATRTASAPTNPTIQVDPATLPTGTSWSIVASPAWIPATGSGTRTYTLTVTTTSAAVATAGDPFTVRALVPGPLPDLTATGTLVIQLPTPTITFAAAPAAEFPGPNFAVSATTNSDGALTYSFVSGPCTQVVANAGTFTPTGLGDCVVQANTAATSNFQAGSKQQTVAIAAPGIHLYAVTGSAALPGGAVPVWGYNSINSPVTQPGGPTLVVNQGATVTINLHNALPANTTALLLQGQNMPPDTVGVAPGGVKTYTFVASQPGTYLYEAGLIPGAEYQVPMGLYGALIVRPAFTGITVGGRTDAAASYFSGSNVVNDPDVVALDVGAVVSGAGIPAGTTVTAVTAGVSFTMSAPAAAYDAATPFNDEAVLVLSEIDPALNASPAAFDLRNYAPKYFLINGKVYPDTAPIASAAGNTVLLRYVNAGARHHSMAVLGLRQSFIAKDASPLPTRNVAMVAETLGPGQTADAIATIPAVTAASRFAVYDGSMMLHNNGAAGFGGMLTFVTAGTAGTGDTTGPTISSMGLSAALVNATISDASTGNSNVVAAEFFIDTTAAGNGNGTPMYTTLPSTFTPAVTVNVIGTISPPLTGTHTVYVHGRDAAGNWGPFQSRVLAIDVTGPTTSALILAPNPSNGSVNVALSATANDTASGGSNVGAAEFFIGATGAPGTGIAMAVNPPGAKVASLTASIPAATVNALSNGTYIVSVRSRDTAPTQNWGGFATTNLVVDKIGPATSSVLAAPNPNDGTQGFNSSTPAVRVTASLSDALSNIAAAEGFIDTVGANGTGFVLQPTDGLFNAPSESAYANIPLTTIAALTNGNHTIYVHGRDAAGNWGATSTTVLVINKVSQLYFSTSGNTNPPGVGGTADDADIYLWNGTAFSRVFDATAAGLPGGANVDGLKVISPTHFYMSFSGGTTTVPGLGTVEDEDIVEYNAGTWSLYFNGTAAGLTANNLDIDAFDIVGGTLYFSTLGNTNPPGVTGTADDADIYSWNGTSFSRVVDATTVGIPGGANVDGLKYISATHFFVSFSGNTTLPVLGAVQDEDIVEYNAGTWSLYFDGTAHGLTTGDLDIDAFSIP